MDTTAQKVWATVDALGTYAVGVPKTVEDEELVVITQTITTYGCGPIATVVLALVTFGFVGLSGKQQ